MSKLDELVNRYGNLKSEMDSYKKQVNADNSEIKSIMKEMDISEHNSGEFTAKYSITVSESFDEDKLVHTLQSIWSNKNGSMTNPYLKMVYIPDMEAIENAIYNGQLNAAELAGCKVTKETPRLTIKRNK